jgi:quercetin dioxygenase-like cupin family protein
MRRIGLLAILGSLAILAIVMNAGTSLATTPSGSTANFTYRATLPPLHSDSNDYKVFQRNSEDIVMRELTISPAGDSGWHFHPGPTYVIVAQGTDTLYEANDPTCTAHNYGPGEGFVEQAGDIHISRNEGTSNLVLFVTFTDVPVHGAFRLDAPRPGNCPF